MSLLIGIHGKQELAAYLTWVPVGMQGISLAFFIDPPPPTPLKSLYNVQTVEHEDEEEEKEVRV